VSSSLLSEFHLQEIVTLCATHTLSPWLTIQPVVKRGGYLVVLKTKSFTPWYFRQICRFYQNSGAFAGMATQLASGFGRVKVHTWGQEKQGERTDLTSAPRGADVKDEGHPTRAEATVIAL